MRSPLWLLLLAPLLLLATGCGKPAGAFCVIDDDCDPLLHCFAGTCQELGTPVGFRDVVFEVQPLPGLGLTEAVFPYGPQPLQFHFCSAAGVEGTFAGEGLAEVAISGSPGSLVDSREPWVETVGPSFWIPLPPGSWTLTFYLPEVDGIAPPPVVRQVGVARCETQRLAVSAPVATREAKVRVVVDEERDPRPRCGVSVRLVDPETRRPLSRTLSIEQPTGPDGEGPVGPCEMPEDGWSLPFVSPAGPTVEVQLRSLDGSRPTIYHLDRQITVPRVGDVDLGVFGVVGSDVTLEPVRIKLVGPDGKAVGGARIQLSPQRPDGADPTDLRWMRPPAATLVAGQAGIYEAWALPGTYTVRIEPRWQDEEVAALSCLAPEGRPGSCGATVPIVAGGPNAFEARLPRRVVVSGHVNAAEPRGPMADARVTAIPLDGGRSFSTRTRAGGRYELRVDPGSYDLLVQPHNPDAAWKQVSFRDDGPLIVDQVLDVSLPRPARVVGYIAAGRDGKRVPLGHAYLRAFRLQGSKPPLWIGEAVADSEGRFALVLPAQE